MHAAKQHFPKILLWHFVLLLSCVSIHTHLEIHTYTRGSTHTWKHRHTHRMYDIPDSLADSPTPQLFFVLCATSTYPVDKASVRFVNTDNSVNPLSMDLVTSVRMCTSSGAMREHET